MGVASKNKLKRSSYIAQYPVFTIGQIILHFSPW